MKPFAPVVAAVLCLAACTSAEVSTPEEALFPPSSAADVQAYSESVRDDFIVQAEAAGMVTSFTPEIDVRSTPQLVFYDPQNEQIVVPFWDDVGDRALFEEFGNALDEETAESFFQEMFNWFLVAHELGHYAQHMTELNDQTRYENEYHANQLAIEYWIARGEEARVREIAEQVTTITTNFGSPLPPEVTDPVAFFNDNYAELSTNPSVYGWYQFIMLQEALAETEDHDFGSMIEQAIAQP